MELCYARRLLLGFSKGYPYNGIQAKRKKEKKKKEKRKKEKKRKKKRKEREKRRKKKERKKSVLNNEFT